MANDMASGRATHEQSQQAVSAVPVGIPDADTFFIDCEFDGHNGPLLSFAIVRGDGDGLHITVTDAPAVRDPWVAANVVPILDNHKSPKASWVPRNEVGGVLRVFMGDCQRPFIVADSPVDIARFCQALSTGIDGGWASTDYPSIVFSVLNVDCWPNDLVGGVQHNAWWDAMALRHAAQGTSAGTAETGTGSGLQPAGPVACDAPEHPNAQDYSNRSQRAEQEATEWRAIAETLAEALECLFPYTGVEFHQEEAMLRLGQKRAPVRQYRNKAKDALTQFHKAKGSE